MKKRTRVLHDLFRTYQPFAGREGKRYRVLITEASTDGLHWVGHTKAYEQVGFVFKCRLPLTSRSNCLFLFWYFRSSCQKNPNCVAEWS